MLPGLAFGLMLALMGAGAVWADDYVGWRTDGTGEYPDARPVTTWSGEENVIWATPMPDRSNSLPVIVGDRIFVSSDPQLLLCVSKATGEIIWQASNSVADIAPPEEIADLETKTAEYNRLRGELAQVNNQLNKIKRQLQDAPDNTELKTQFDRLQQQQRELAAQIKPLAETWYVLPPTHAYNGFSSPTPVCDGEHVWVVFGNGVAACYDLDGNRVWARFVEKPPHDWGTSNTPVLADGRLIVHIGAMRALDPLTGEEVWSQPAATWNWGTSWVEEIGGVRVIFTSSGHAVRASDGKILASGLGKLTWGSGPMVDDGVLYYIDNQGGESVSRAWRLPANADEPFQPELIWQSEPNKARYYASPIIRDGLIYAVTTTGMLSCIDVATGEIVYEQNLALGKGDIFGSVVYAGGYLMVTHENGTTVVFQPGRGYVEVARNQLGDMVRSTLVFDGDAMYVRGYEKLYCIGAGAG
ncbi:MAG: PQQ-binding-like beta-propeller repeat protein [Armatimonadota bacterium]